MASPNKPSALTANEKRVLLALSKIKSADLQKLAIASGLQVDAAMQVAFLLAKKGLANIVEEMLALYSLTPEGELHARQGLPEQRILAYTKDKPITLSELKKAFADKEISIALGWLRRKGLASIRKKDKKIIIEPFKTREKDLQEEILRYLLAHQPEDLASYSSATVQELLGRDLIRCTERTSRLIAITNEGRKLVRKGIEIEEDVGQLTPDLIRSGEWKKKCLRPYDIHAPSMRIFAAKKHPYQRLLDEMRQIFLEMGFEEIRGDIIQTSFWNFDALFQPQDHPAREMQDTFYLDSKGELPGEYVRNVKDVHEHGGDIGSTGWGGHWSKELAKANVLRTHTTTLTIRHLAENPNPPVKAFCIGRVYRREAIDATHLPEFEQLEGVVMDEGVSFRNLLGCLAEFYHRMGFADVRFRPGYFPYTEPSVEPEVHVPELGWIELGGAGIFRREVTAPLGIKHPVLAWGLGVSRLAMLRLGLRDLRDLYNPDIDWLRRYPISQLSDGKNE
ncbi:MAG: phenylalanine--tRNA ligase subunit alpha [Methanocellales archaeon]|nr:phenylalanine--tRNA ligase subunit alpha [Methanocellales archaeon]